MSDGKTYEFDPDWVVRPGDTLREFMEENNLPKSALALACGRMPLELLDKVLNGRTEITEKIAEGLEIGTQISAFLWLNLERAYRAGLKAGKTVIS